MASASPLLTRRRVLLAEIETAKGTENASPTRTAVRVYDPVFNPTASFEQRKGSGKQLGNVETGTLGPRSGTANFSAELRGDGSGDLDAGLAILLQGCGFLKTSKVYNLHSAHAAQSCLSIYSCQELLEKQILGSMGNVTIEGEAGGKVMCNFEFSGTWVAPDTLATAFEAIAYAPGVGAPLCLRSGTFTLGGNSIKINKFSLNIGCQVVARPDIVAPGGIAYFMITDYDPVISIDPEADTPTGNDFYGEWLAGTEPSGGISLALDNGTDAVTIAALNVQYKEIGEGDRDGIATNEITCQCRHTPNPSTGAGDDAVIITAAAHSA